MNNPFEYPVIEAGNNFAGRDGKEKTERNIFNIFEKKKMEMGMKGQRGSVKMFGKEIEFPLGGKEGKKKEFLPLRFRKRISEVGCTQTRLYVCVCVWRLREPLLFRQRSFGFLLLCGFLLERGISQLAGTHEHS